ncbi:hypothetical protein HDE_02386 [Halotydeus destructor]|nr:hypothetical protein HDE_02386 [Halotydeus destructor]
MMSDYSLAFLFVFIAISLGDFSGTSSDVDKPLTPPPFPTTVMPLSPFRPRPVRVKNFGHRLGGRQRQAAASTTSTTTTSAPDNQPDYYEDEITTTTTTTTTTTERPKRRRGSRRGQGRTRTAATTTTTTTMAPDNYDYYEDEYEDEITTTTARPKRRRGGRRGQGRRRTTPSTTTTSTEPTTTTTLSPGYRPRADGRIIDFLADPNFPFELKGTDLTDYPFYIRVPDSLAISFSCQKRRDGYYANIDLHCQIYHHCAVGHRYDFLCPNYTLFDQTTFTCRFVNTVDCPKSETHYKLNHDLYVFSDENGNFPTESSASSSKSSSTTPAPPVASGQSKKYKPFGSAEADRPKRDSEPTSGLAANMGPAMGSGRGPSQPGSASETTSP